jgi:hypothetical protein
MTFLDLKVCGNGILIQLYIIHYYPLSIIALLYRTNSVSETGLCLNLQVEPMQLKNVLQFIEVYMIVLPVTLKEGIMSFQKTSSE